MKKTFLQYTAESLLEKFNCDLSGVTVVFPNKRASLFFNEYLARAAKRPIWSPSYITISELFRQHSKLTVGDPIKLICDLHKSFVRQTGIDETLDRFYGWGQLLLADFDDIDKNMADADKVFQNLSDYHNFDNIDYLSDEQIKVLHKFFENFDETHNSKLKDKFLKLWSRLRNIYEDYNSQLTNQGIAYEGALYRKVVQDNTTDFGCRCYVFVGFNVLQKVETMLFDHLIKEKKALFYWDFDKYYLNDKSEAGHYVKQYLKRYPNELDYDDDNIYNNFSNKKDITYISVPTENIQARYITKWLRSNNRIEAGRNTAIVLCDESLLQGVIHCLPPEADKVNITIGYPLSQSPVYSFVCKLIKLQTSGYSNNDGRFRLNYVKSLLKHPYANYVSENCTTLLNSINENKISYLYLSQLCIDENFTMLFGMSHEKGTTREFLCELSHWILIVLKHIAKQKVDNAPLFQESVFRTYTIVNRLVNLIESDDLDVDINTSLPNRFPHAISNAETGIRNIPMFMDVIAVRFAIHLVMKLTQQTTTKGFTLAIQPGLAVSPAIRITYLGIVAYNCCCTIQNPVTIRIRINKRQLVMMRRKPWPISRILLPSPAVCADLYRRTTDSNARIVIVAEKKLI